MQLNKKFGVKKKNKNVNKLQIINVILFIVCNFFSQKNSAINAKKKIKYIFRYKEGRVILERALVNETEGIEEIPVNNDD